MKLAIILSGLLLCVYLANAQTPNDIQFELRCTRNPPIFHIGEKVELELAFSTTAPDKYLFVNSSSRDHNNFFNYEHYVISPSEGVIDPQPHQNDGVFLISGSWLHGLPHPISESITRHVDLNDWIRFLKPGHYVLTTVTSGFSLLGETISPDNRRLSIKSNQVEFDIIPADQAWAASELADIIGVLDSSAATLEQKHDATRRLRYLNSEETATELATVI